jgi:outer membrane protein
MKKTRSTAILLATAILTLGTFAWGAELKIGVIVPDRIMNETKQGKKIKATLEDYGTLRKKLSESEASDIRQMEEDLTKQGTAALKPSARQEMEAAYRQKVALFQRHFQERKTEIQTKQSELLAELVQTVKLVVGEIAEKEKINLVIEQMDTGLGSLILFSHSSLDLTDRVINAMNAKGDK